MGIPKILIAKLVHITPISLWFMVLITGGGRIIEYDSFVSGDHQWLIPQLWLTMLVGGLEPWFFFNFRQ